jgi:hypothetical protein
MAAAHYFELPCSITLALPAQQVGCRYFWRQQNFAGAGLLLNLLVHLKIKMRQQTLTLFFYDGN